MNPFLKEFNCSSNKELYQKLSKDYELAAKYRDYDKNIESYYDHLTNQKELDSRKLSSSFLLNNGLDQSEKPSIILMNERFQPIKHIELDILKNAWLNKRVVEQINNTPYASKVMLNVPEKATKLPNIKKFPTFFTEIRRKTNLICHEIESASPTDQKITVIDGETKASQRFDYFVVDLSATSGIDTSIFNRDLNYLDGYHDFKHYLAEQKIMGLHIEKDSAKIEKILLGAYKTQPYETSEIITLTKRGEINSFTQLAKGDVRSTSMPFDKMQTIVQERQAEAFICIHNHPSGINLPSDKDLDTTQKMVKHFKETSPCMDHFIVGSDVFSFRENNLIKDHTQSFERQADLDLDLE
ncbi:JAB domain-containing protein [Brackiella oedipodis]|uniref:JAB domain-containing protein n=1 Tax=Brackiella oedipodis TaxID=124225 RepID=UPI00048CD917|nr:JAB domain-containing protein [Brackiella oedipodis]